jgi:CheY-like chemotaxis protein
MPDSAAQSGCRVLVVDDNRDAARSMALLLRITGHEVQTAFDGDEALAVAEQFLPHAILLDLGLPKRNGYEVARAIRAQPWGRSMMLIAVTGWGEDDQRERASEAGFDHHCVKPVEAAELAPLLAAARPAD